MAAVKKQLFKAARSGARILRTKASRLLKEARKKRVTVAKFFPNKDEEQGTVHTKADLGHTHELHAKQRVKPVKFSEEVGDNKKMSHSNGSGGKSLRGS